MPTRSDVPRACLCQTLAASARTLQCSILPQQRLKYFQSIVLRPSFTDRPAMAAEGRKSDAKSRLKKTISKLRAKVDPAHACYMGEA